MGGYEIQVQAGISILLNDVQLLRMSVSLQDKCLMSKTIFKLPYLECSTTLGHVIQGSGGISLLGDFQGSPTQKASLV